MVVEQSLLAGINSGFGLLTPPTPSRYHFIGVVIAAFSRAIALKTGVPYDVAYSCLMALPDELADYLETPNGWKVLAKITSLDVDFRPTVH